MERIEFEYNVDILPGVRLYIGPGDPESTEDGGEAFRLELHCCECSKTWPPVSLSEGIAKRHGLTWQDLLYDPEGFLGRLRGAVDVPRIIAYAMRRDGCAHVGPLLEKRD